MARKRLGDVLRERKRITEEDLAQALEEQQRTATMLGELLLAKGVLNKEDLIVSLEEVSRVSYVDARFATVETAVLELIPRAVAQRHCVLPLMKEAKRIVCVMAEPQNLRIVDEIRFLTGMEVVPRLGFRQEISEAIDRCYGSESAKDSDGAELLPFIQQMDVSDMQFVSAGSSERNKAAMEEFEAEMRKEKTPAVRLLSSILAAAAAKGASDIHIEPQSTSTIVRVRVDGVLRELTHVPTELSTFLVSRVKILSDMDIAERRTPQDGRFLVRIGTKQLDLRASTLPTHYGEKVVLRVLDSAATKVAFTDLGFAQDVADTLQAALKAPQGMVLVTGPTGSGKSTTLYSALHLLRSPQVNIITVEDPVEYKLEDVNQVQINPKAGLTFASCLRSMLRQDPNIIMVGEIRDQETALIALQAAQTGHLVLSTLHTNDAIAAVTRLIDLGVPPFLIAASVSAVVAQRLVRKLCKCRKEVPVSEEYVQRLLMAGIVEFGNSMFVPTGCHLCDGTGFKGRIGIYEMLTMDEQIKNVIRNSFKDEEVRMMARSGGMMLMQEDALNKVSSGITTLDEVLRVVPFDQQQTASRCRACGKNLAPAFLFCPYCGAGTRQSNAGHGSLRAKA